MPPDFKVYSRTLLICALAVLALACCAVARGACAGVAITFLCIVTHGLILSFIMLFHYQLNTRTICSSYRFKEKIERMDNAAFYW